MAPATLFAPSPRNCQTIAIDTRLRYNAGVEIERITLDQEPEGFTWFAKPAHFSFGNGLTLHTEPLTDFWQRTHYGIRRDTGHALLRRFSESFTLTTEVTYEPTSQYDQCGVFVRTDAANWLKASVEYEGDEPSHLGSVVTTLGYSDWAWQDIDASVRTLSYRVSKRESDILVEWTRDGNPWTSIRIAHLHAQGEEVEAGIYACSPVGEGFDCRFSYIEFGPCEWNATPPM